jgi:hypothetical protein
MQNGPDPQLAQAFEGPSIVYPQAPDGSRTVSERDVL